MGVDLLGAVEAVYEAAASPHEWGRALDLLAGLVGATAGVVVYGASEADCAPLAIHGDPGNGPGVNPRVLLACLAGRIVGEVALADPRSLPEASVWIRWQVEEAAPSPADALGVALLRQPGALAALWLFPGYGAPFGSAEQVRLRRVVPHLIRALELHHRVEIAEERALASGQAFDRIAAGAILVDEHGRPLLTNRTARRILAQYDGFGLDLDGLTGGTQAETASLRAAIRDTVKRRSREGAGMLIGRRSQAPPYEVIVLPLGAEPCPFARQRPAAIVFITDRTLAASSPGSLLRDLYCLTSAETRLVLLLLAGQSPAEAAAALGISRHTAHTQLASVFRKTETTSQPELIRVLLRSAGAVRAASGSSDIHPHVDLETLDA